MFGWLYGTLVRLGKSAAFSMFLIVLCGLTMLSQLPESPYD
jgi:hypothetical protein